MKFKPITHADDLKNLIRLTIPNSLQQLVRMLGVFISTMMIGRLGHNELAANALCYSLVIVLLIFTSGLFHAVLLTVGKSFGESDDQGVTHHVINGLRLAVFASVILTFIIVNGETLLSWFGQDLMIVKLTHGYLMGLSISIFPGLITVIFVQFYLGIYRTRILNIFAVYVLIANIIFCYVLIFGKFGFPKMGLAGAGYSNALTAWLGLFIFLGYSYWRGVFKKYPIFRQFFTASWTDFPLLLRLGLPIGLTQVLETVALLVIVFLIGTVNIYALAAYQLVSQLGLLAIMISYGVNQAIAVMNSNNVGAQHMEKIKPDSSLSIGLSLLPVIVFSLVFLLLPKQLLSLFVGTHNYAELIHYGIIMLGITAGFQLFDSVRVACIGALRGIRDIIVPLIYSIIGFWIVGIPLAVCAGFVFHFGAIGIWIAYGISMIVTSILVIVRYYQRISLQIYTI